MAWQSYTPKEIEELHGLEWALEVTSLYSERGWINKILPGTPEWETCFGDLCDIKKGLEPGSWRKR